MDLSKLLSEEVVMVNITEIAKAFGTTPEKWLRNKETQTYLEAYSKYSDMGINELIVVREGRYGGTWIHNELLVVFNRWLNPEFAIKCDMLIKTYIQGKIKFEKVRQEQKDTYQPMTDAIKDEFDDPKWYIYANENDLIYKLVLGLTAKQFKLLKEVENVRDYVDKETADLILELQKANTMLLKMEIDKELRVEQLKLLASKVRK